MMGRAGIAAALFVLSLSARQPARAAAGGEDGAPPIEGTRDGTRVVVIGGDEDVSSTSRIAAELRALGFSVEVHTVASAPDAAAGNRAFRAGARAVVQVDGRSGSTDVSVADPRGRAILLRRTLEGARGPSIDPLLVVRTVELVRATLLGVGSASSAPSTPGPPVADPAPPAAAAAGEPAGTALSAPAVIPSRPLPAEPVAEGGSRRDAVGDSGGAAEAPATATATGSDPGTPATGAPRRRSEGGDRAPADEAPARIRGALSSGLSMAGGGLDRQAVAALLVGVRLVGPLQLELLGVAPLSSSATAGAAGSSRSSLWLGGGGLAARVISRGRVAIDLGAGALAVWLRATGSVAPGAPSGVVAATDAALGAAVHGHVGAAVTLGRSVAVRADVFAGDVFRRPVVSLDGRTVAAAWGPAYLLALVGFELRGF